MGEELLKKINNNNYKIVNELIELIVTENIDSILKLKEYQDELFRTNGILLSHDNEIKYCINNIQKNGIIPENVDFIDAQKIIKLNENIVSQNLEEQTLTVIVLYSLLDKEMMLPYDAYNLIMNGKI